MREGSRTPPVKLNLQMFAWVDQERGGEEEDEIKANWAGISHGHGRCQCRQRQQVSIVSCVANERGRGLTAADRLNDDTATITVIKSHPSQILRPDQGIVLIGHCAVHVPRPLDHTIQPPCLSSWHRTRRRWLASVMSGRNPEQQGAADTGHSVRERPERATTSG